MTTCSICGEALRILRAGGFTYQPTTMTPVVNRQGQEIGMTVESHICFSCSDADASRSPLIWEDMVHAAR